MLDVTGKLWDKPGNELFVGPEEPGNPQATRCPTWDAPEIHWGEVQSRVWHPVWKKYGEQKRKESEPPNVMG